MTEIIWPLTTIVVVALIWDALRMYLSRDDLEEQVRETQSEVDAALRRVSEQTSAVEELAERVSEVERVASTTRDRLSAEQVARPVRSHIPTFRFDRPAK